MYTKAIAKINEQKLFAVKKRNIADISNKRRKVDFNFQMSKIDTKIINEKLEEVFKKLDSAAKINIAIGFVL